MDESETLKQWMVVYTKPRNEKVANERLQADGIETYLPLHETMKQWSDRKKKVKEPLFKSYVFVKVEEKERLKVLQDASVLNFVYWLGKPATIQDKEIEKIRYFLKEAVNQEIYIETLLPGEIAQVNSGHFKDEKVAILSSEKHDYFVILLSLGVRLRISKLDIEKVKK